LTAYRLSVSIPLRAICAHAREADTIPLGNPDPHHDLIPAWSHRWSARAAGSIGRVVVLPQAPRGRGGALGGTASIRDDGLARSVRAALDGDSGEAIGFDTLMGAQDRFSCRAGQSAGRSTPIKACRQLGIEPTIREWDGECGTPEAFAVSMNLHWRHLTTRQRSLIAAAMATMKGEVGKIADHPSNGKDAETPGLSARRAAEAMQVSTRTVEDAKTVLRRGTPQEVEAAKAGRASVSDIARQIRQGNTARERAVPKKVRSKIRAAPKMTRERELITRVQECVITLSLLCRP